MYLQLFSIKERDAIRPGLNLYFDDNFRRIAQWGLACDLEYPIFNPKHGFLSSVEAEITSFCQIRQPFSSSAFYVPSLIFQGGSPSKFDK